MTKFVKLEKAESPNNDLETPDSYIRLISSSIECFFCLKPLRNRSDYCNGDKVCLDTISRFITLSAQNDNKNVSVCDKCGGIANQLSSQIELLELTKMKVDYGIQQLQTILQHSTQQQSPVVKYEPTADYRNQFTEKCSTKVQQVLNHRLPVVRLHRTKMETPQRLPVVKLERLKLEDCDPRILKALKNDLVSVFDQSLNTEMSEVDTIFPTRGRSRIHGIMDKLSEQYYKPMNNNDKSVNRRLLCQLCKSHDSFSVSNRRAHFVIFHLDKIFEHQKPKGETSLDFYSMCSQAVKKEVSVCKFNGKMMNCVYCNMKLQKSSAEYHLVTQHFEQLEKRLAEKLPKKTDQLKKNVQFKEAPQPEVVKSEAPVQPNESVKCRNPEVESIFQNIESYHFCKRGNDELQCLNCNVILPSSRVRMHVVRHHPEKLFARQRNKEHVSQEEFKVFCVYAMDFKAQQAKRFVNKKQIRDSISCPKCDAKVSSSRLLRYHIVAEHFTEMEEKIDELQFEGIPDVTLYPF